MYSAAIYFGAKHYKYDIDGFLLQRSYDFMFIISHMQILIKNSEFYTNTVSKVKSIFKPTYDSMSCIKNNLVRKISLASLFFENLPQDHDYDMFIYKHENETDSKIDNILYYSVPEPQTLNYDRCNYTFIQTILKFTYNDSPFEYKINLRDETNNYYIVNNKLNSVFLGYFLRLNYGVNYDMKNIAYSLTIMDHEVRQITLTENHELILSENDYTVEDVMANKSNASSDDESDD
jgi:hypothetical protein